MTKSSQDLFYDLILELPVRRVNCCVDNPRYVVRSFNGFDDLHQFFEYYDDAIFAIARRIEMCRIISGGFITPVMSVYQP